MPSVTLTVRLTKWEREHLKEMSLKMGCKQSTLIRAALSLARFYVHTAEGRDAFRAHVNDD